jgi:hypothetical protein
MFHGTVRYSIIIMDWKKMDIMDWIINPRFSLGLSILGDQYWIPNARLSIYSILNE